MSRLAWILRFVPGLGVVVMACVAKREAPGDRESGKIAVTTTSAEARQSFEEGRSLGENLRSPLARTFLEQAVAQDPGLAIAHYQLALNQQSLEGFLDHMAQAKALSDKASEGERLLILAVEAASISGDPAKAVLLSEELVAKYPNDERAHTLLGIWYGAQQQYDKAIAAYRKAVEVNPSHAPAWNLLGYAYRPVGNFGEAEKAFKRYIELIPNDPNPYDSYAELLMKTGRFDESIEQYRKALSLDPTFTLSTQGIAADLVYQGKYDAARAEVAPLLEPGRSAVDQRRARVARMMSYAAERQIPMAIGEAKAIQEASAAAADTAQVIFDLGTVGDLQLASGDVAGAGKTYEQAVGLARASSLPPEYKADVELAHHYNLGRTALTAQDPAEARQHADALMSGATARANQGRIQEAHQLLGLVALQEKDGKAATAHLSEANQQDAYTLFMLGTAKVMAGDKGGGKAMFGRAAAMNELPTLPAMLILAPARKLAQ